MNAPVTRRPRFLAKVPLAPTATPARFSHAPGRAPSAAPPAPAQHAEQPAAARDAELAAQDGRARG
jgi:hypothetical protein